MRERSYQMTYLTNATHHEFATHASEHLHLLPGIRSPQTSDPLIAHCRSKPTNRLPPWIVNICMKRKLPLPVFNTHTKPFCPYGHRPDKFGDYLFPLPKLMNLQDRSPQPPCPPLDLDSSDVLRILSANADAHLQVF
jgi:hypothetical protein